MRVTALTTPHSEVGAGGGGRGSRRHKRLLPTGKVGTGCTVERGRRVRGGCGYAGRGDRPRQFGAWVLPTSDLRCNPSFPPHIWSFFQ